MGAYTGTNLDYTYQRVLPFGAGQVL